MSNGPCYGGKEAGEGSLLLDSDASRPRAEKEGEYLSYSPCPHPHELCLQTWETQCCVAACKAASPRSLPAFRQPRQEGTASFRQRREEQVPFCYGT